MRQSQSLRAWQFRTFWAPDLSASRARTERAPVLQWVTVRAWVIEALFVCQFLASFTPVLLVNSRASQPWGGKGIKIRRYTVEFTAKAWAITALFFACVIACLPLARALAITGSYGSIAIVRAAANRRIAEAAIVGTWKTFSASIRKKRDNKTDILGRYCACNCLHILIDPASSRARLAR